ncbi:hypothetical protein B0T26DRAFT_731152 [Lasiosphaeria miniovina]|uniref:F-box domain-containing protein n=1 Tax=Lasiosphaeria miniovina TaxID=1954250 RepID=A0AA39ZTG4_9PEZI|nr:uncharacterized protein B0T26DRAFT_731152 [Lasiosphaeria miniovina]KAK0703394.1 hypothetical protein B0T26DRAFT_731152 [Lasiosphaeria miniovina]
MFVTRPLRPFRQIIMRKMRTLITWIKKAFPRRRRETATEDDADSDDEIKESDTANTEDAAEQVDTGQQLEKQHPRHLSRQMLLTLREMESTGMDPLIAALVYNMKHSPIHRLPDELVLQVLRCIGDDPLTMLCLRRVARRFRRIIDEPEIWKVMRMGPSWTSRIWISECLCSLPKDVGDELLPRIYMDGMCDECILQPGVPNKGGWLQRRGMCQHVNISWADIEPYISKWQQQQNSHDGQVCLDGFRSECRDPSHDMRCRAKGAPTWPRASLNAESQPPNCVELLFEWTPPSGFGVVSLTPEGRMPASEVRRLFQRHRQGAADIIFPSRPHLPLPEMACFNFAGCQCLLYETGGDQSLILARPSKRTRQIFRRDSFSPCPASHSFGRCHGSYFFGEHVTMRRSCSQIQPDSVCLVAYYSRSITVHTSVNRKSGIAVTPGPDWYHAVDPDLSPSSLQGLPKMLCRDKSCINYYRSPSSFACRFRR